MKIEQKNKKLLEKAKNVKAVVFDGLGVLFSATVFVDPEKGEVLRTRSHADGQGISLLRGAGIKVAFVTAGGDGFLDMIGNKMNSLPSVQSGKWDRVSVFKGVIGKDKIPPVEKWLSENSIDWDECAYMGDDIGDYEIMKKAGFPSAPSQAEKIIKDISLFISERPGGEGAVRDLTNFILEAKGIDFTSLDMK